jgi:hypothetical protein
LLLAWQKIVKISPFDPNEVEIKNTLALFILLTSLDIKPVTSQGSKLKIGKNSKK